MNIYFPKADPSLLNELVKIAPIYPLPASKKNIYENYLIGIESTILEILSEKSLNLAATFHNLRNKEALNNFFQSIAEDCPIIKPVFHCEGKEITLTITSLTKALHSREVGRFICDYFSKWLLPGKNLTLTHVHSEIIQFDLFKGKGFFFHEIFIHISSKKQLLTIQSNLQTLIEELKINILAVAHARAVLSVGNLTEEQKKMIVSENISELLDIPSKGYNHNLYEQMQDFLIKASSEEKISRIKESISPLLDLKPQIFERDLFNEIQRFILPSMKDFAIHRNLTYVARIISYSYLLRKRAAHAFISNPSERFAVTKVLRTHLSIDGHKKPVIGLLVAINYTSESEFFDKRHLLAAANSLIPKAVLVQSSTIHNKREDTGTRIIYLEIEKKDENFTGDEIKLLQTSLTEKVLDRVESVINSLFMPRNDEEILRNIITLGAQLKFPTDLPQVMINYRAQEHSNLIFTVLLVRIQHPDLVPIPKKFKRNKQDIYIKEREEKTVGHVRKSIPKKGYILDICCPKEAYLRADFSLDLTRARRDVFSFITDSVGEVRDFNGGMISKQNEALVDLKRALLQNNFSDDFLVENFFYSFIPRFMQCIIPTPALKHSFLLMLEALEHDFNDAIYFIKTITWERYSIITVSTINQSFKEFIEDKVSSVDFDSSSLAISYTNTHEIPVLSYILNFSEQSQSERLLKTLVSGIKEWKESLS